MGGGAFYFAFYPPDHSNIYNVNLRASAADALHDFLGGQRVRGQNIDFREGTHFTKTRIDTQHFSSSFYSFLFYS